MPYTEKIHAAIVAHTRAHAHIDCKASVKEAEARTKADAKAKEIRERTYARQSERKQD
jgi:hypothetical protein